MTLFEKIYNFQGNQMSKKVEKVVLKALVVMN